MSVEGSTFIIFMIKFILRASFQRGVLGLSGIRPLAPSASPQTFLTYRASQTYNFCETKPPYHLKVAPQKKLSQMNQMKLIPVGQSNFEKIANLPGYVDLTPFLLQVFEQTWKVGQFCFPPRWGKSTLLSMVGWCCTKGINLRVLILLYQEELRKLQKELVVLNEEIDGDCEKINESLSSLDKLKKQKIKKQLKIKQQKSLDNRIQRELYERSINQQIYKKKRFEREQIKKQISDTTEILEKKEYLWKLLEDKAMYLRIKQKFEKYDSIPVINISLPSIEFTEQTTYEEVTRHYKKAISKTFQEHSYLIPALQQRINKQTWKEVKQSIRAKVRCFQIISQNKLNLEKKLLKKSQGELPTNYNVDEALFSDFFFKNSIKFLCELLVDHWGKKPIILIDDYDTAYIENLGTNFQAKIYALLNDFYRQTLQGWNEKNYFKAVTMGIFPIKDCNEITPCLASITESMATINSRKIISGFTEENVTEQLKYILSNRGELKTEQERERMLEEQKKYLKAWAKGYWAQNHELYNPWTINSCLKKIFHAQTLPVKTFQPGWVPMRHFTIIKKIISKAGEIGEEILTEFILNKFRRYEGSINYWYSVHISELMSQQYLFFFLFHSGYLTKDRRNPKCYVTPNKEVASVFYREIFMILMEKRYPGLSKQIEREITAIYRSSCKTVEDPSSFGNSLEGMINYCINVRHENMSQLVQSSKQALQSLRKIYERDIQTYLTLRQAQQDQTGIYEDYEVKVKYSTPSGDKMDRFFYSKNKNTVIIHEDKITNSQGEVDGKSYEALKQILDKYLQTVPRVIQKEQTTEVKEAEKNEVKYIQIAAFLIFQDLKTNGKEQVLKYQVKILTESYTFAFQKVELLRTYRDNSEKWENSVCSAEEKRKEFRQMLHSYSVNSQKDLK